MNLGNKEIKLLENLVKLYGLLKNFIREKF